MAIVRTLLLAGAAVMLLPTEAEDQKRLLARAGAAVHWAQTFCDRNDAICAKAAQFGATFAQKGQFAAEMGVKMIRQWADAEAHPELKRANDVSSAKSQRTLNGTLTDADRIPVWRGQAANRSGV